jgi:hypothetical protein
MATRVKGWSNNIALAPRIAEPGFLQAQDEDRRPHRGIHCTAIGMQEHNLEIGDG